jgi:hypothetical protein
MAKWFTLHILEINCMSNLLAKLVPTAWLELFEEYIRFNIRLAVLNKEFFFEGDDQQVGANSAEFTRGGGGPGSKAQGQIDVYK